mmetsp:Transcript_86090/g.229744  ORF Transcript_86090/g.229744 Transcript_86090/m.229744 type:complete len:226 (+) Transcript_86090:362-1039(+)
MAGSASPALYAAASSLRFFCSSLRSSCHRRDVPLCSAPTVAKRRGQGVSSQVFCSMSNTGVRITSSMSALTSAALFASGPIDSLVTYSLVPMTAPSQPNVSIAARPRPSQMPPAASTSGLCADVSLSLSTAAASGSVPAPTSDRSPWPPASRPWVRITSHPAAKASLASWRFPTCAKMYLAPSLLATSTLLGPFPSPSCAITDGAQNWTISGLCFSRTLRICPSG